MYFRQNIFMHKVFGIVFLSCWVFTVAAQTDTKTVSFTGNRFTMVIPADADSMTAAGIRLKYHKEPDAKTDYYASKNLSFSVVLNIVSENVKEDDMVKHKEALLAPVVAKYKLVENEVRKVNNHRLIVIAFYSDVPDGKILNKRFFAVANGKLLMVSFNATEAELPKRKPQIEQSINSVLIK
jgi:hypothetical protein